MIERALVQFIHAQHSESAAQTTEDRVINQGDVYWITFQNPSDSHYPHPHVVIQDNLFNHSRLDRVVVCAITSNVKKLNMPGNVGLDIGEANLTRRSIVEVAKLLSVEKGQLGDYIGSLSAERVEQILAGIGLVQRSFFNR